MGQKVAPQLVDADRTLQTAGVSGHRAANPPGLSSVAGLPVLEPISAWCQLMRRCGPGGGARRVRVVVAHRV